MSEARFLRTPRRTLVVFLTCTLVLAGGLLTTPAMPVTAANTLHVTSCADSGATTLRGQIAAASAGDTIVFDQDCTLIEVLGTMTLTQSVTIDGTGHTVIVDGGCTANCGTVSAVGGVTVFTVNSGVTASLTALTIQHGHSTANYGGGINNMGRLTVTNSTISGNTAGFGGGIENALFSSLTVTNSTISGNSATSAGDLFRGGGGIDNSNGSVVTVTNSTLSGNTAGSHGGGIDSLGTVYVTNTTLSGNTAHDGGGIFNDGTSSLTVTNSTFRDNTAGNSGGGIDQGSSTATVTVTNSTFAGNSGQGNGGAIAIITGRAYVTNSTIDSNGAGAGGGIYNSGTVTVTNVIAANDNAPNGPDLSGVITSGGHNLIATISGSTGITNGVNGDLVDPNTLLGSIGSYGGPTQTIPLLPGSPAIAAGDDTVCATAPVGGTDQRGITRPQGAHCAIGAVES